MTKLFEILNVGSISQGQFRAVEFKEKASPLCLSGLSVTLPPPSLPHSLEQLLQPSIVVQGTLQTLRTRLELLKPPALRTDGFWVLTSSIGRESLFAFPVQILSDTLVSPL